MHHTKKFTAFAVMTAVAMSLGLQSAHAELPAFSGIDAPPAADQAFALGIGTAIDRSPYRGVSDKVTVFPLVFYTSAHFRVLGNTIDLLLPSAGRVRFSLRAKYALNEGYKASDSSFLTGMGERKGSVWLGGVATWENRIVSVSGQWAVAAGQSNAQRLTLAAEHRFMAGQVEVTPRIAAEWNDKKYVDYYFGVHDAEAASGRPAYVGAAATDITLGVHFSYLMAPHHMVTVGIADLRRGKHEADSPLIGKATSASVNIGYAYRF